MSEEREAIRHSLERVLNELLERGAQVLDNVYIDKCITHLSGKSNKEYSDILKSPFLIEWVNRSFAMVNTDKQNGQLYAFTLRLLALVMENEWQFLSVVEKDICIRMNEHIANHKSLQTPSIKLAHVNVLGAMLRHSVGIKWLIGSRSWTLVLDYCLQNETIYVVRESQTFLSRFTLIVASDLNDLALCTEIITASTAPLAKEMTFQNNVCPVDASHLYRKVVPCLELMCSFMDYTIKSTKKSCIAAVLHHGKFRVDMWRLTDMTKDELIFRHIITALVYLNFVEYIDGLDNKANQSLNENQFGLHFFNQLKYCYLARKNALTTLSCANSYHHLWTTLADRLPQTIVLEGNIINFENQIISLQITPILFSIATHEKDPEESELFDAYIMKLFDISTDHTLRVCYGLRDLLVKNRSQISTVSCKSIQGIMSMKQLHRDRAVYVFQALCYSLKDFAYNIRPREEVPVTPDSSDRLIESPHLVSEILLGLHKLISEYNITWKESIESMCVLRFMMVLLSKPSLTSRIAVQALKLSQLCVERFMSPNLLLLDANMAGTSLELLGPTIMRRLHDVNWEVRDSTLEMLTSIATIANVKYPPFQTLIQSCYLIDPIVQLAKNDSEAFVRASALNCLCALADLKRLWDENLAAYDLMEHLLTTIHTESEGIVRKEYCSLIAQIYRKYPLSARHYELVFPTMAHVACLDLYWEAKIGALQFWHNVIVRQFCDNGVIDGAFPAVIFSKRQRKIVTLTPKEIESRLNTIFDELQQHGALGVLLECLNDACDLKVVQEARGCALRMDTFLRQYDYRKMVTNLADLSLWDAETRKLAEAAAKARQAQSDAVQSSVLFMPAKRVIDGDAGQAEADVVIENIVSSDDINLLGATVSGDGGAHSAGVEALPHLDPKFFERMRAVSSEEYLRRVSEMNLNTLMDTRGAWMEKNESFAALLDDMLYSLQLGDASNADCY